MSLDRDTHDRAMTTAHPAGRVCCEMRVTGAPETRGGQTTIVAPERVQWEAWVLPDARLFADVTVFGQDVDGIQRTATFFPAYDDRPSWIPAPPAWYVDAVAELRAAAEDLSRERVAR